MKKYDIFLLDADDTLFDFGMAEANALKIMFDRRGLPYSEEIRLIYREINAKVWEGYERGEITKAELQPLRFKRLFEVIGAGLNPQAFNDDYLYELGRGSFLLDGAMEICAEIAENGKQIFIVTNGILVTQQARIEHSAIRQHISDYFVSEFVGYKKPQREYFEYVLGHIPDVGRDKILVAGDSLTADIAGGNGAGLDTCWLNPEGNINDTDILPKYEIASLHELRQFK